MAILLTFLIAAPIGAQKKLSKYDDTFRKYSKRYFGPDFDWRFFKAQGIAESGLSEDAQSAVGARGLMQLMPSTFTEIQSANPEFEKIDDPVWNIAAGIYYDRALFRAWKDIDTVGEKMNFTFGSYNAGRGTIIKAQLKAKDKNLDHKSWTSIGAVAPEIPKWKHDETLGYVEKIRKFHIRLIK